ncbi:cytochrome c biogenesis protein CcdA [Haloarcula litorea]|uniref:cytochrome c biogenesis protein CcdA n=1 Tax=Haloarcula litorea TaxID=3032579 RepID=UPI0023E7660D|nr:cytochrome c biogenesis protein CcdA [Halomicroarcula sp. GDY20]
MVTATQLAGTFALGLATPLTAVCVLPLYPGFLAYLSNRTNEGRLSIGVLGGLVAAGVLASMLGLGLVFTTLLQTSLTDVVGVVSPAAFALLGAASLLLLADVEFGRFVPSVEPPQTNHPVASAFGYGAFFGAIVVPCNPGFVAVFLARSFLFTDPVGSLANFLAFGGGIAAPLVTLALVSDRWQSRVLGALTRHRSLVNRATGAVMLAVSVYYLVAVFEVVG